MEQIFYLIGTNWKSCLLTDDYVVISSQRHELEKDFVDEHEMSDSCVRIDLTSIASFERNDKKLTVSLNYNVGQVATQSTELLFQDADQIAHFSGTVNRSGSFDESVKEMSPWVYSSLPILFVFLGAWLFWYLRSLAISVQNNTYEMASSWMSGITNFVAKIAGFVGPTIVTLVGIAAVPYLAYLAYHDFQNPPRSIVYEKINN